MKPKKAKSTPESSAESRLDQPPSPAASETGRYAYEGLDRVIHEKARLGILSSLAAHPNGLFFSDLKDLCSLTDGNLSRHLQTLQEAELIEVWKRFQLKRPQTLCRLTDLGRQRLLAYIDALEQVVADAAVAARQAMSSAQSARAALSVTRPGLAPG